MRRLDLEGDLRRAIEQRALEVAYQPIVQAATGRIVGFEALVPLARRPRRLRRAGRLRADRRGDRADRAARRARCSSAACAQLARVARSCRSGAGLTIGVNVSRRQLAEPGFVDRCSPTRSRETGLDPRALRLEVSEHELSRGRADDATRRVLEHAARDARRAHAHRRLRHGRLVAAAAAPLPGRRDQDLTARWSSAWATTRARSRSSRRSSGSRTTSGSR